MLFISLLICEIIQEDLNINMIQISVCWLLIFFFI